MGCLASLVRVVVISVVVAVVMVLIAERGKKTDERQPQDAAVEVAKDDDALRLRMAQIEPLVRIPDIARKTPTQVQKLLGPATKRQLFMLPGGRKSVWNHYRDDSVMVLYVRGKANMVMLFPAQMSIQEPNEILAILGLEPIPNARWPDGNRNQMRWDNTHGLVEIVYERVGLLRGVQEIRVMISE